MQPDLVAGDTLNFATTAAGYSAAEGWALKFRLVPRSASGAAIDIAATAEGNDFRVAVAASVTATWGAGVYGWWSWVEKGAEKYSLQSGQITIQPDPRQAAAGVDMRSQARKALDDAKAALAAWSPLKRRYRIGDREMEFNGTADILRIVNYWQLEVNREQAAGDATQAALNSGRFYIRATR